MPGIMKQAKLKAIMDIISQMDDLEMDRMMPKDMEEKMYDMEEKPVKKGITIMKLESSKKPKMEMEEEEEGDDMEEDDSEEIDPLSSLARLKERLKKGRM
jgi:hypothetical protein